MIGMQRGQAAWMSVFHAFSSVSAAASRTSPTMMRSGRKRSVLFNSDRLTSPHCFSSTMLSALQVISTVSSIRTIRSLG